VNKRIVLAVVLSVLFAATLLPLIAGCNAAGAGGSNGPLVGSGFIISGTIQTTALNPGLTLPAYWKDGALSLLSTGSQTNGGANNVEIQGTDIYFFGFTENGTTNNSKTPVYWKNGSLHTLTLPGGYYGVASDGKFDSLGHLYIRGNAYSATSVEQPGYWIDGVWTPLSRTLSSGTATTGTADNILLVDTSDHVYASGWLTDPSSGLQVPVYWRDGTLNEVSLAAVPGATYGGAVMAVESPPLTPSVTMLLSINDSSYNPTPAYKIGGNPIVQVSTSPGSVWFVFPSPSGDQYATGMTGSWSAGAYPTYWLNWTVHALPTPAGKPFGTSEVAYISGSHVTISGTLWGSDGLNAAALWIDGALSVLTNGGYAGASQGSFLPD
jgi:hypothetical protein